MTALVIPAIALAIFLAIAWSSAAVLFPAYDALVARKPRLARASLLVATLPIIAGLTVALAAVLPGDSHLGMLLGCHCGTVIPGWQHLCPTHPTTAPAVLLPAAALLLLLVPGRLRALALLAGEPLGTGTGAVPSVVDLPRPIALLAGWLRPSLLVDRTLWASLRTEHREAIIAHERAHLARRDPLVLATLRLLTSVAPPRRAHTLLKRWLDNAELSADAAAGSVVDPLVLAEALVACARLAPAPARTPLLGWTAGHLETRVRTLLERPTTSQPARPDAGMVDGALLIAALVCALLSLPWLHHQVEHLLNLSL